MTDDKLTRCTIRGTGKPHPGFNIPEPPVGHPEHGKPRAGFVGDERPLAERLADAGVK